MGSNQGSEWVRWMLRHIIKGQGQVHIANRSGPGSDGVKGYGQSHFGGQKSGTMFFQEAETG